jgi:hypothetical protein
VIDEDPALGHHLLDLPKAQRIGRVPAHAHQHHFQRVVHPLNHSAQRFKHLRTVKLHRLTLPAQAYCDRTGNRHGQRLRDFGCFRNAPGDDPRPDWCLDADRATEAAERLLLADAGAPELQSAVPLVEAALLKGLETEQCAQMLTVLTEQRLAAGELLFQEGDAGDAICVLTEGSISIVAKRTPDHQRFVTFPPGMMFGETAMLDGSGRTAAAIADRETVMHQLDKTTFEHLSVTDPKLGQRLALNIAVHLAERLRSASTAWRASAG